MSYFRSIALDFGGDYTYEIKRGQDVIIFTPTNKNREIQDRIYLLNNPVLKSIETENKQYYIDIGNRHNGNRKRRNGNGQRRNGNGQRRNANGFNGLNGLTGGRWSRKTKTGTKQNKTKTRTKTKTKT